MECPVNWKRVAETGELVKGTAVAEGYSVDGAPLIKLRNKDPKWSTLRIVQGRGGRKCR